MMRQLLRSVTAFSWAQSLFLARQTAALATAWLPDSAPDDAVREGFDGVRRALAGELDGMILGTYQVADALQRDVVDLLAPDDVWSPADWMRSALAAAAVGGRTARYLTPTPSGCDAWRELGNKLEVYLLVKQVARRIGVPAAGEPFDLESLVERCYALGDFAALWAVEGLGHDYASHFWPPEGSGGWPEGLLQGARSAGLPAKSLTMLHAGIGLAFAQRLLAGAPGERTTAAVADVLAACRESSRPGYEGAAIESLGLVTRTFHGDLVGEVDAALRRLGEESARGFFWHGVGRALYFLPINFLPAGDTTWRPFEMGLAEAPDPQARANVLAGLGWAFTLVNMRQPTLLERLLLEPFGRRLEAESGFANGVASSILMRTDTTPSAAIIDRFLAHRPAERVAGPWNLLVAEPSRRALEHVYPRFRRQGRLGEIFRYRPDVGRHGDGRVA